MLVVVCCLTRNRYKSVAVRQGPFSRLRASERRVILRDEIGEFDVGGPHVIIHGFEDGVAQRLAIGFRKGGGELASGQAENVGLAGRLGDGPNLRDDVFEQKLRRHQMVALALLERFG